MVINLEDFRRIEILVNAEKDIVIFPLSEITHPVELANGEMVEGLYQVAYYPIELKYPYTNTELADKIRFGIEQWNQHECYSGSKTFEEKYYGVKGFKNAVKGNLFINLGWDDIQGKYVSLLMPLKRGHSYIGLANTKLDADADWIDFANAVIDYINLDYTKLRSFKTYKSSLNI